MSELLQILNSFQGIIGAILGSVTTLVVTDILKKKGHLKSYLISYDDNFQSFQDVCCSLDGKKEEDIYAYHAGYTIQIYNKSDTPKIMRDFKLIFKENKKERHSLIPHDEETRSYSRPFSYPEKMEVVNIAPKEIQVLKQSICVIYDMLDRIEGANKVELQYKDEKDRKRKIALSNKLITTGYCALEKSLSKINS
jgi:hypothetical protein